MRVRTGKTKNGRLFYIIKTYYDTHGVEHTITVENWGMSTISAKGSEGIPTSGRGKEPSS